jgi:hypothetical protein
MADANDCDCCAETFHNPNLQEIAFVPEEFVVDLNPLSECEPVN